MFPDHKNMGKEPQFMVLLCAVKKIWAFFIIPYMGIYGHMTIFAHNANGPNFLTVHDNTINCGSLPMFLWSGNMIKMFKMLLD